MLGARGSPAAGEFQALIGTVETTLVALMDALELEFQALIGTVETGAGTAPGRCGRRVSSPHRYCRNGGAGRGSSVGSGGFKPS